MPWARIERDANPVFSSRSSTKLLHLEPRTQQNTTSTRSLSFTKGLQKAFKGLGPKADVAQERPEQADHGLQQHDVLHALVADDGEDARSQQGAQLARSRRDAVQRAAGPSKIISVDLLENMKKNTKKH